MKRIKMTAWSVRYPWIVVGLMLAAVLFFGAQFPKVVFDNDPENMLDENEPVRVFHNQVKERYTLYDSVIVGVVNETHPDGIFNVETLGRIDALTHELASLYQTSDGSVAVLRDGEEYLPDLRADSAWQRMLARAFGNDVNRLFEEDGSPAIIAREIMSPSVVDNIRQADRGQLAIEYLMEAPPQTREEALAIRTDAMNNPLYKGTLVSGDGQAIAIYIPITKKTYSYNVANLVEKLTEHWDHDGERVFITGQPVAQDTFGVEMLVQMASSAPLAGLAIFLLLLFFFRRVSLVIAPMIVAMVSVIVTMGLLIGLGYPVHIMSSMIAIFLMPISVSDSVHILSEFFDIYPRYRNKAETIKNVISHLFFPMFYTTLTTMVGFASLAFTPIPPVRVFGLHVAFGVALAWVLTMTFVPAYIMLFVRTKMLDDLKPETATQNHGLLGRSLGRLGGFSYHRWRWILAATMVVAAISAYGISRIRVNDNPVKWFTQNHRIRVSDDVLNHHLDGTYMAYLTLEPKRVEMPTFCERMGIMHAAAQARFGGMMSEEAQQFVAELEQAETKFKTLHTRDEVRCFADLVAKAEKLDETVSGVWNELGDTMVYLDPEGLDYNTLMEAVASSGDASSRRILAEQMEPSRSLEGAELQDRALAIIEEYAALSFVDFLFEARADAAAPPFKRPEMLAYVEQLQLFMQTLPTVGKTSSALDALKKANYELNYVAEESPERNRAFYAVPPTPSAIGQVFIQLEGMKKKDSLFHMITRDYAELNIWVQLKSGDNTDMQVVVSAVEEWVAEHPAPTELRAEWAGLTYINVEWQKKMVSGMFSSLLSSFVVVLVMMMVLFRSPLFGTLAMIPLSVTIAFIYGVIGLVGKDYDMPVAVLSSLTLGLSVDFAIHFLERSREFRKKYGSWKVAIEHMFREPALAISRNAIVISVGFLPLLFAPLVPYRTVGFFLAAIMAVSWLSTLFILAALITVLQKFVFKRENSETIVKSNP